MSPPPPSPATDGQRRGRPTGTGQTVTARFIDGPLKEKRTESAVVEGRPPKVIDVPADDGATYRYCLAEWTQAGPSARYTFLYRV
jgi:hypothetical protein